MVYKLPGDAGLGRRCKAKAMAKAVELLNDTVTVAAGAEVAAAVAAAENEKATEAAAAATAAEKKKATEAEDRRRQHHDWRFGYGGDWHMQAASQASPCGDMEETAMLDNPAAAAPAAAATASEAEEATTTAAIRATIRADIEAEQQRMIMAWAWEDYAKEAALLPSPWNDMEESASIDNPVGSVEHASASGLGASIGSVQRQP
jgi:hypothetical protein